MHEVYQRHIWLAMEQAPLLLKNKTLKKFTIPLYANELEALNRIARELSFRSAISPTLGTVAPH